MQADVNVPRRGPVQGQARHQDFEGRSPLDAAITRTILVPGKIQEVFDFVAAEGVFARSLDWLWAGPGRGFNFGRYRSLGHARIKSDGAFSRWKHCP